jgi:hypothetical protein
MPWETRIDRNRNHYLMRLWGLLSDAEAMLDTLEGR